MKKWIRYALALAAIPVLSYGGFGGLDVGNLRPVQTVMVQLENGKLKLLTDTGDVGQGETVHKALEDMNKTADARLYLDTAEYLLLGGGTEEYLYQLREYLRPSCNLCTVAGQIDINKVGSYLEIHPPERTMAQYEAGERKLPRLISEEGRLKLVHDEIAPSTA